MNSEQRRTFFKRFSPGLIVLTFFYTFLTAYRDFRDNFAREIWDHIGFAGKAHVYTTSEIPIALLVMGALGAIMFVKGNKRAATLNPWNTSKSKLTMRANIIPVNPAATVWYT